VGHGRQGLARKFRVGGCFVPTDAAYGVSRDFVRVAAEFPRGGPRPSRRIDEEPHCFFPRDFFTALAERKFPVLALPIAPLIYKGFKLAIGDLVLIKPERREGWAFDGRVRGTGRHRDHVRRHHASSFQHEEQRLSRPNTTLHIFVSVLRYPDAHKGGRDRQCVRKLPEALFRRRWLQVRPVENRGARRLRFDSRRTTAMVDRLVECRVGGQDLASLHCHCKSIDKTLLGAKAVNLRNCFVVYPARTALPQHPPARESYNHHDDYGD
jgi:hypothetical protein